MDGRTDGEVMAASQGEAQHFAVIYERYFAQIYRYVARRIGSSAADDLTAEVFLRAFARRVQFDPAAVTARPWLYGFAANIVADHLRSQRRRTRAYVHAIEPDPGPATTTEVDDRFDATLLAPQINRALASLSAAERETFLLFVLGDLSYAEVAAALDIPIGTVRSRIAKARGKMRELVYGYRQT